MARYKLVKDEDLNITGVIVNDGTHPELPQGASIPNSAGNRHWVEYVDWDVSNDTDAADTVDYMARMRDQRGSLLVACDWTQIPDVLLSTAGGSLTQGDIDSYAAYRQELRDMPEDNPGITTKAGYDGLVWPTEPTI